ncbi:MAG TPA: cupin domain-containing protein [Microthrixaceae bacterium]|nr:cupin domain-containing protein [Microthrixaceae bacterium]
MSTFDLSTFDPSTAVAALARDGTSEVIESRSGPPVRIDGVTVGAPLMTASAPHRGELHPDGDELLYLISGRVAVVLDDGDIETVGIEERFALEPGTACIVPRGVWHRVEVLEPSHLVHVTPGPGGGHRPL